MLTVLLTIHLLIASALVGVVLLQRSEGGALGIGGGGGAGGGFLTGRGTANLLTRVTAALAAGFFATSILLSMVTRNTSVPGSAFDRVPAAGTSAPASDVTPGSKPAEPGGEAPRGGILDKLK